MDEAPAEVEDWMHRHLAGELDAEDAASLRAWLGADPAHRALFMRRVRFHEELAHAATERARRIAPGGIASGAPIGHSARRRRLPHRSRLRRRPVLAAGLAALLALAVGGALLVGHPGGPPPDVRLESGTARSSAGGIIAPGDGLPADGTLDLPSGGVLVWMDGSRVALAPGSRASPVAGGLALHGGRLRADIRPRAPDRRFTIATAQARITVVGTVFTVAAGPASTSVGVESGRVRVAGSQGDPQELGPGERAEVSGLGPVGRILPVAPALDPRPGSAFPTLSAAWSAARPGDIIELQPGWHGLAAGGVASTAPILLAGGGRAGAPVVVRGLPGARVVSDAWNAVVIRDGAWIEVRGIRLEYRGTAASAESGNGIQVEGSRHIVIDGCEILGFGGDGIHAAGSDHLRIHDTLVDGCGGSAYGTHGGITIASPIPGDGASGHRIRIERNRILRSRVEAPNRHNPGQWTAGNGITLFATDPDAYPHRILVEGNLIAHSAGSGIATFQLGRVDIRRNILHGSGLQPKHPAGDVQIASPECTAEGNLLVPLPGRRAWHVKPGGGLQRRGNAVWESDRVPRQEVPVHERLSREPYLVPSDDGAARTDFRLIPGLGVGPGS